MIIADPDEQYLAPIESKFLSEFDDRIELELITLPDYFKHYFETPRKADVLVVGEAFYTPDLQRHNMGHIFILTEQLETESTDDLRITKVFKYTSTAAIFNKIVAVSGLATEGIQDHKETTVILVSSASGGTGKTTLALGMSACLAQSYKKVLYINAERMNTFQRWLDNEGTLPNSLYATLGSRPFRSNQTNHTAMNILTIYRLLLRHYHPLI